jgi:hypothetical protein
MIIAFVFWLFTPYGNVTPIGPFETSVECERVRIKAIEHVMTNHRTASECYKIIVR